MYGLLERDFKCIKEAISKYDEIEEVIIFGSRAMGNYKKASDVDIAIIGDRISRKTVRRFSDDLNEEYPLPYFFDVIDYNEISNEDLKEHIHNVGKTIYNKSDN